MIEIFVVRHAVTDWNTERRFQGHSDIPINGASRSELPSTVSLLPGKALSYWQVL